MNQSSQCKQGRQSQSSANRGNVLSETERGHWPTIARW